MPTPEPIIAAATNIDTNIDTIINAISQMQETEAALVDERTRLLARSECSNRTTANPNPIPCEKNLSTEENTFIVNNIQRVRNARNALWNSILDRSEIINTGIGNARNSLISQVALLKIVEDELNSASDQLNTITGNNDTMNRMLQINTHYGSKFEAKTDLLKLTLKVFVPLILVILLKNYGYIPDSISKILIALIISIGGIIIIRATWDINTRSEMNFDEYDWKYEDPSIHIPSIWQYNKDHLFNFDNPLKNLAENLGICIGEGCCDNGMYYNDSKQKCVKGLRLPTESFMSGQLTGTELIDDKSRDKTIQGVTNISSMLGNASLL